MNGKESAESPLLIGTEELGARAQGSQIANGRKERSDKGQPRLYVEVPCVRFDVSGEDGRSELNAWLAGRIASVGSGELVMPVTRVVNELLAIIDRLRK
jgi:hypothetical protein